MADQHTVIIKGKETKEDDWQAPLPGNGWEHAQTGPCPDCKGGQWVWAENGNVPGTRQCSCGSMFSVQPRPDGWFLRRERIYRG